MGYSKKKVPILQDWIDKAVDFHSQKACIVVLKKEDSLFHSSFSSTPHSTLYPTWDPNVMDVDFVCLKKLSPAKCACCMREGLCFRCWKKGHNADNCNSNQI